MEPEIPPSTAAKSLSLFIRGGGVGGLALSLGGMLGGAELLDQLASSGDVVLTTGYALASTLLGTEERSSAVAAIAIRLIT